MRFRSRPSFFLAPFHDGLMRAVFRSRAPKRMVEMNGTRRPRGVWRIAGLGPFEWIISHRPFLRMMEIDRFQSIYTPKPKKRRRKMIPGLDSQYRRGPIEKWPARGEEAPF